MTSILLLLLVGALSQDLGKPMIEANCSSNEESQAKFLNVAWGFEPSVSRDVIDDNIMTCYAVIDCTSSDDTTEPYTTVSTNYGCLYEWRFNISLDFDFCQVVVHYDHIDDGYAKTSATNCSFSEHLMVTSTPFTLSVPGNDGSSNIVDSDIPSVHAVTMHTIYTASEEHVDPTITSSPVSVAMTISTRTSLNSVRTSSDPEATVSSATAHPPNAGSSQVAIIISLVVALLMLIFVIVCLGVVLYKLRRKLPLKMHMKKEKDTKLNYMIPPFYDDNYAYSTYGKDASSTVESLGVNDKVTDWIRDLRMPSIDEECGSVISDDITNEEMLDHLYGHSTTIRKKEVKPRVSVGSADSGVGSENSKEPSQKNLYISEQQVDELLHTSNEEGQVSPDTETASWNEGDGQGNSRPSSLSGSLISTNKHNQEMGNPTAVDTPTTPVVGSCQRNSFPKSRKFAPLVISKLPSVSDSVFTHSLSEGNYVDHRLASTSDSACQSPDMSAGVGKTSPGFENISTPPCFVHDSTSHNTSSSDDRCVTPTIGVYQSQNIAAEHDSEENSLQGDSIDSEVTCTFLPHPADTNTVVVKETITGLTSCAAPFHIMPIKDIFTIPFSGCGATSEEVGTYVSHNIMSNDENDSHSADDSTTAKREAFFPSKLRNSHINTSFTVDQHATLTDGVYLPHSESVSNVNTVMPLSVSAQYHALTTGQYTSSDVPVNHNDTMGSRTDNLSQCFGNDSLDLDRTTPVVEGNYVGHDIASSKQGSDNFTVTASSVSCSSFPLNLSINLQPITPPNGEYMPYNVAVEEFQDTVPQVPLSQSTLDNLETGGSESSEPFSANEVTNANLSFYDEHDTTTTGLYVSCGTAYSCNQLTILNETSTTGHHLQQSYGQDHTSGTTVPVAVSNYISHNVVTSKEDAKSTNNHEHDDALTTVSIADRCDTPVTGMYIAYSATVEDAHILSNDILTLSQQNTIDSPQEEDKDLSSTNDHYNAPITGQYFPYGTLASKSAQFDSSLLYQDSSVTPGNYVSNDITINNEQQSTSFRARNPSASDHSTLTIGVYMPNSYV